jgi:hypothetical protein
MEFYSNYLINLFLVISINFYIHGHYIAKAYKNENMFYDC